jgi:predicted DsbA family dithiol-disulfide isomerase
VRLRKLRDEYGERLVLEWKAFLLRPYPTERSLPDFVRYTGSWLRPAAEPDAGRFRVWESGEGPPTHSVPPHVVAKAAQKLGDDAFESIHRRLFEAYFWDHRDVTAVPVLRELWTELGLPEEGFPGPSEDLLAVIAAEHQEAIDLNVSGVPAVRRQDQEVAVVGAQPLDAYRRWIEKTLG